MSHFDLSSLRVLCAYALMMQVLFSASLHAVILLLVLAGEHNINHTSRKKEGMSQHTLTSFRWYGNDWQAATSTLDCSRNNPSSDTIHSETDGGQIRIATLNILADCWPWFIEKVIRSTERYEGLIEAIFDLDPTILGQNEVTPSDLTFLLQSPFIRKNYFITATSTNCQHITPHGSVVLSKLLIVEVLTIAVTGRNRDAVVGKIRLSEMAETCIHFCSLHTTHRQSRVQQVRDVIDTLQPLSLPFIIAGDLNLYYEYEDAMIIDQNLMDAWAQTHFSELTPFNDQDPGYTFDSVKNTFIPSYSPGNCRQMRLDCILFSHGFPAYAKQSSVLWANNPIRNDCYLFSSDHFGLYIDIYLGKSTEQ
jgi:endonuclease/exonuclease/phosphatase family metal-dependent hydrolase